MVYKEVRVIYDVFQNFVVCSNYAVDLLAAFKAVDKKFINAILKEARTNIEEARDAIVNLRSGYPSLMKQVDQHHCEYYVLHHFTKHYHHLGETG